MIYFRCLTNSMAHLYINICFQAFLHFTLCAFLSHLPFGDSHCAHNLMRWSSHKRQWDANFTKPRKDPELDMMNRWSLFASLVWLPSNASAGPWREDLSPITPCLPRREQAPVISRNVGGRLRIASCNGAPLSSSVILCLSWLIICRTCTTREARERMGSFF